MRLIGKIDDPAEAQRFCDYLCTQGIDSQLEETESAAREVWVHAEEHLARAQEFLAAFRANPGDPVYAEVGEKAAALRAVAAEEELKAAKRMKGASEIFSDMSWRGMGYVTVTLIAISVGLFILKQFLPGGDYPSFLYITEVTVLGDRYEFYRGLPDILHGQVWRLFTPALMHFGLMHIIFNMLWLRDLGGLIERIEGSRKFLLMVLVMAGLSNAGQYAVSGPMFGGMSGVVYGLLGYLWIRGKVDPWYQAHLHPSTVTMMLVWFVFCFLGILPIANTAHAVGLGLGMAWGYVTGRLAKSNR